MNTTVLKGVTIGNNVIIGAGSLVNHDIPDNCVAAGNPARVIMSLEDYYAKRKEAQYAEAAELVRLYRDRYHKEPGPAQLNEFFWLFCDGESELAAPWKEKMKLVRNEDMAYERLTQNRKVAANMEDFMKKITRDGFDS